MSTMVQTIDLDELSRVPKMESPVVEVSAATPAYAQYTSGTTGLPKAALHRHSDPSGYYTPMSHVLQFQPDDVLYSISKIYFAYGFGNTIVFRLLRRSRTG